MQILSLKSKKPLEWMEEILKEGGFAILYTTTEGAINEVCIEKPLNFDQKNFLWLTSIQEFSYQAVNWEEQAKEQPHFQAGYYQIDLTPYGKNKNLILVPGPGFGNELHPTTQLVLNLMAPQVNNQNVIDIGSGSGILSLVAKAIGAKKVIGIDLDEASNLHAAKNAILNQLETVHFQLPKAFKAFKQTEGIILMNMIYTEQIAALEQLTPYLFKKAVIFTSGVLKSQLALYLKLTSAWGWQLKQKKQLKGWLGFEFTKA